MLIAQPQQAKQVPAEFVEQAELEVTRIFNALKGSHLGWRANIKTQAEYDNARREWLKLLLKHRLTADEIAQGLEMAELDKNPYLPSFGQFFEWCKTVNYERLGLPSVDELLKRLNLFSAFGFDGITQFKFKNDAEYWLLTGLYQQNKKYVWKEETLRKQATEALAQMAKQVKAGTVPKRTVTIEKPKEYVPAHPLIEARMRAMQQAKGAQNGI